MYDELVNITSVTLTYDEKYRNIKANVALKFDDGHKNKKTFKGITEVRNVLNSFAAQIGVPLSVLCSDEKKVIIKDQRLLENGVLIGFGDDVRKIAFDRATGNFVGRSLRRSDFVKPVKEEKPPVYGFDTTNIYLIIAAIKKLNPSVEIRVGVAGICVDYDKKIFSSVPGDKLVLPEGISFDGTNIVVVTKDGVTKSLNVIDVNLIPTDQRDVVFLPSDLDLTNKELVAKKNAELVENFYLSAAKREEELKKQEEEKRKKEELEKKKKEEELKKKKEEEEKKKKGKLATIIEKRKEKIKERTKIKLRKINKKAIAWASILVLGGVTIAAVASNINKKSDNGDDSNTRGGDKKAESSSDDPYYGISSEVGGVEEFDADPYYIPPEEMGAVEMIPLDSRYDENGRYSSLGSNNGYDSMDVQLDTITDKAMRPESFLFEEFVVDDDFVAVCTINNMRRKVLNGECTQKEFMDNLVRYVFENDTYFDGSFLEPYNNLHPYSQYIVIRISEGALQWDKSYRGQTPHMIHDFASLSDSYRIMGNDLYDDLITKSNTK